MRSSKKKVLEDANNSKLRRLVTVRVEDCLRRVKEIVPAAPASEEPEVSEEASVKEESASPEPEPPPSPEHSDEPEPVTEPRVDDDGPPPASPERMELPGDASSVAVRFPDDRSDSGVSSLRSGSGDERSGSRSSALSGVDEPQSSKKSASPLVWREHTPSVSVSASVSEVRHVQSVQHQSLLMSHPGGSAPQAPPATSHYPPPPLMAPHPLHLPPPGPHPHTHPHLYSTSSLDMLWKPRYHQPSMPVHHQAAAEELLERERAFAQDRDRHERLIRYVHSRLCPVE